MDDFQVCHKEKSKFSSVIDMRSAVSDQIPQPTRLGSFHFINTGMRVAFENTQPEKQERELWSEMSYMYLHGV